MTEIAHESTSTTAKPCVAGVKTWNSTGEPQEIDNRPEKLSPNEPLEANSPGPGWASGHLLRSNAIVNINLNLLIDGQTGLILV